MALRSMTAPQVRVMRNGHYVIMTGLLQAAATLGVAIA